MFTATALGALLGLWLPAATMLPQFVQDRETTAALVREFKRGLMDSQLEVGEKIVALHDRQVLPQLESGLVDQDRHARAGTAFVFASYGDPRGFDVLADILTDTSPRPQGVGVPLAPWSVAGQIKADRYYAVHVLGLIRDERSVDLLLPLLTDRELNYKAAWALGQIGSPRAIQPLIRLLSDSNALVRVCAIDALATMGANEALPAIRRLVDDRAVPNAGDQIPVAETARRAIAQLEKR